jgi:hypothetical protein
MPLRGHCFLASKGKDFTIHYQFMDVSPSSYIEHHPFYLIHHFSILDYTCIKHDDES